VIVPSGELNQGGCGCRAVSKLQPRHTKDEWHTRAPFTGPPRLQCPQIYLSPEERARGPLLALRFQERMAVAPGSKLAPFSFCWPEPPFGEHIKTANACPLLEHRRRSLSCISHTDKVNGGDTWDTHGTLAGHTWETPGGTSKLRQATSFKPGLL
jgi:hypothetical protein